MQNNTVRAMQEEAVDRGRLQVQVINYGRAVPVEDAVVDIAYTGDPDSTIEEVNTNANGQTEILELAAPPWSTACSRPETSPIPNIPCRSLLQDMRR